MGASYRLNCGAQLGFHLVGHRLQPPRFAGHLNQELRSIASTSTCVLSAGSVRTMTLHGKKSNPIWRSMLTARWASGGLHAPQNQVILHVLTEFRLQRGLHIDLSENPEALVCQCLTGAGHRIGKTRTAARWRSRWSSNTLPAYVGVVVSSTVRRASNSAESDQVWVDRTYVVER